MARAVLHFVQELVSAAPAFLRQCIAALVNSFLPAEGDEPEKDEALTGKDEVSALVHVALESILRACPVATDYVFGSLKATFPHKRREAVAHAVYVRHCIAVLRYSPALMKRVVGLLVARMVELDVEIALQQRHLEDAAEEEEDYDEPIFEVDLGDNMSEEVAKMRKNADKLDGMMALMFEFIAERCKGLKSSARPAGIATPGMVVAEGEEQAEDVDEAERLLHALLVAFHESVLYTYKCRCVQFLLFFACSFSERFTAAFTNFLLRQVSNEQVHAEARIASAAYIASFLARASFVPLFTVLSPLYELLRWAERYQADSAAKLGGAPARLDVALHGVFYAVMQGCLYLLCYKNAALNKPEVTHEREVLGALVGRIAAGRLNPLKFCQDAVLIEFERCDAFPLFNALQAVYAFPSTPTSHLGAS
jgi:RNA polymerase I-specific transcription initiation factor RRN3